MGSWVCGRERNWSSELRLQEMVFLESAVNIIEGKRGGNFGYIYAGHILHIEPFASIEHIDLIELGTGRSNLSVVYYQIQIRFQVRL